MPGYAFFNAFSDFAIPGPWKIEPIQKLSKVIVVHRSNLKVPGLLIQGKIITLSVGVMEYCRNWVLRQMKLSWNKQDILLIQLKRPWMKTLIPVISIIWMLPLQNAITRSIGCMYLRCLRCFYFTARDFLTSRIGTSKIHNRIRS